MIDSQAENQTHTVRIKHQATDTATLTQPSQRPKSALSYFQVIVLRFHCNKSSRGTLFFLSKNSIRILRLKFCENCSKLKKKRFFDKIRGGSLFTLHTRSGCRREAFSWCQSTHYCVIINIYCVHWTRHIMYLCTIC